MKHLKCRTIKPTDTSDSGIRPENSSYETNHTQKCQKIVDLQLNM